MWLTILNIGLVLFSLIIPKRIGYEKKRRILPNDPEVQFIEENLLVGNSGTLSDQSFGEEIVTPTDQRRSQDEDTPLRNGSGEISPELATFLAVTDVHKNLNELEELRSSWDKDSDQQLSLEEIDIGIQDLLEGKQNIYQR